MIQEGLAVVQDYVAVVSGQASAGVPCSNPLCSPFSAVPYESLGEIVTDHHWVLNQPSALFSSQESANCGLQAKPCLLPVSVSQVLLEYRHDHCLHVVYDRFYSTVARIYIIWSFTVKVCQPLL